MSCTRTTDGGIWEIFIPNLPEGTHYKYAIKSRFLGYEVDKADPYGFYAELRPSTDSRVWDIDKYAWQDEEWMAQRAERQALDQPINVYEVHLGSWKRVPEDKWLPHLSRSGPSTRRLCQGDGLHPHRTAADHRASLRRLVGLPDDRLLCADQPLWHA